MVQPHFFQIVGVFLLQIVLAVGGAGAETLPDPTRPPFGEETDSVPATIPVLQSVMLSATRKAAMISGQTVVLGEKFGDARLVKLTAGEAVLRTGEDFLVLKLFPDVEKKERLAPADEGKSGNIASRAALKKKAKQ